MPCNVVVPKRVLAVLITLAFVLCLSGTYAAAQPTWQPKNEVFGGYSWIHPNGSVDWGKVPDISSGFDVSITHYFSGMRNIGVVFDGSGHLAKSTGDYSDVGTAFAGLQYKYHSPQLAPFVRVMGGAARFTPNYLPTEWKPAIDVGGGLDLPLGKRFTVRMAQFDYIWSYYRQQNLVHTSYNFNMIRLAAGLEVAIGYYQTAPLTAACTAQPASVMAGEPVKVNATGTGFNPKHTLQYGWTTTGGKLSATNGESETIDTTGMAAGTYTANATITDPKGSKNHNVSNCGANFNVNVPHNPPQVTCQANPQTVQAGTPSTITATATSPDNAAISNYAWTSTGGHISGTGNTATLDTTGASPGEISVTVTATDARGLAGNCTSTVTVEAPPQPPQVTNISSIQFPDMKRPWRVDNTAKAILDDVASRMKADPNAKIAIVGYADGEKAPMEGKGKGRHPMDLAAQRAVNAKAYLVQQQGIDPSRIDVRKGTGKSQTADIDWIPQGADASTAPILQGTTSVDESAVKPSTNAYPMPHTAAPHHHHAAKKPAANQ